MMRRAIVLGAAILAALLIAACTSEADTRGTTAEPSRVRADLEAHQWALDHDDSSLQATGGNRPTIAFRADTAEGSAPCNGYRAALTLDGDAIRLTDIAATLMSCGAEGDDAEAEYLGALGNVRTVATHEDDRMVLTGPDALRLSYVAYDAREAIVRSWHVVSVLRANAVTSVLDGTAPVLTFTKDGNLGLTTGCNMVGGDWTLARDVLAIKNVRTTLMACYDPPGVMEQETALVQALDAAQSAEVLPAALTLRNQDGSIVLTATAAR